MTPSTSPVLSTDARRKKVLKVVFISLLLDLISFTFILPLFPKLLEYYRSIDAAHSTPLNPTILTRTLNLLNTYKNSFARPINDRYDIVLLGGALGSLFSLCQAIASPFIGSLSDRHGRRTALLWSMVGNILSVALWVAASDFRTFLASRLVGGLSEGNVQLALAIATDVSDEKQRGSTMALVGAAFSIAFTFGPALGAALSKVTLVASNPFAVAAGFSLFLIVVETIYLYFCLPETLPSLTRSEQKAVDDKEQPTPSKPARRVNSHLLLNTTHFLFIFFFSGLEFSLPFLSYDEFGYTQSQTGKLLGFIGLIASLLQGGMRKRLSSYRAVQGGVLACVLAFFLLSNVSSERQLYAGAALLAFTSATVVMGLNSLSSVEAGEAERGGKLGLHRSWGQVGRALGPLVFCSLYWWMGRRAAYLLGGSGMVGVLALAYGALRDPQSAGDAPTKQDSKKTR